MNAQTYVFIYLNRLEFTFTVYSNLSKNSQIPLFFEIISVLPLFEKYLVIYHFFDEFKKIEYHKKCHMGLDYVEFEFVAMCYSSLRHLSINNCSCGFLFFLSFVRVTWEKVVKDSERV